MDSRFKKIDLLNLQDVEQELAVLMSLNPDTMSDETAERIDSLIRVAKILGTRKEY